MRTRKCCLGLLCGCVLLIVGGGVARAGELCDIFYVNALDETVIAVRVKYSTPYDEPRYSTSRIDLRPGGDYRIRVQGTTLPEMIIVDLATKSYVFADLSGLEPTNAMRIAIARENDSPLIRRLDGDGAITGVERDYLTAANRPNAIDKDVVMDVAAFADLGEIIRKRIEEMRGSLGDVEAAAVEAGPIWNQAHALERCPEVAKKWGAENGRQARWTGSWRTTVPGEMSVCDCMTGAADEAATVTIEDDGWGRMAYFPVFWTELLGVGIAPERERSDAGLPVVMRFRLPNVGAPDLLNELFSDLRVDGYRPLRFELKAVDMDADGDPTEPLEEHVDFRETDGDKWDAHDRIMEMVTDGFARSVIRGEITWIEDKAFEKLKAGEEASAARRVFSAFTNGSLEAIFLPDGGRY